MCDREAAGKRGAADRAKGKTGKLGGADQAEGKAGKTGRCGSGGRKSGESWAARTGRKEKRGAADRAEGKVCRQLCGGGEDKQNLRFVEHGEEWN